jgi:hypothetical protein
MVFLEKEKIVYKNHFMYAPRIVKKKRKFGRSPVPKSLDEKDFPGYQWENFFV